MYDKKNLYRVESMMICINQILIYLYRTMIKKESRERQIASKYNKLLKSSKKT